MHCIISERHSQTSETPSTYEKEVPYLKLQEIEKVSSKREAGGYGDAVEFQPIFNKCWHFTHKDSTWNIMVHPKPRFTDTPKNIRNLLMFVEEDENTAASSLVD